MISLPSADDPTAAAMKRLGRPGLEPLVAELARRFEAGAGMPVNVRVIGLNGVQRTALADLFDRDSLPSDPATVRVDRLCACLGIADAMALQICVEQLHGPLDDRAAARREQERIKRDLWTWFADRSRRVDIRGLGPLREWPAAVRRDGIRGTVVDHRQLLADALQVIEALPQNGVPLAVFATAVVNDPHALDRGRRLARLVTGAIADAAQRPAPDGAEQTRETWEVVGVEPDPLSSTVLSLGLRLEREHPLAASVNAHAVVGEPISLTLSQLRRWPMPPLRSGITVFVVENPSLLAEASRRGWSGPPLVCSSGRPSMAVVHLLRQLVAQGARARQHADFDAAGLGICTWLANHARTVPWRMTADEYRSLTMAAGGRIEFTGRVPDTPWDPALADEVRRTGLAVFEEQVSSDLLDAMLKGKGNTPDCP